MNATYITTYDATDIRSWSGTGYYIPKSMIDYQGINVDYLGNLKNVPYLATKLREKFHAYAGKRYLINRNPKILTNYAKQITSRLNTKTQFVFGPSSIPFSKLDTNIPIIFWTDAVFADIIDFYPAYTNLTSDSIKNGHLHEKEAIDRATFAVYSSDWAAESAIKNYQADPKKVKVVTYGANLEINHDLEYIRTRIKKLDREKCNLLFLGVHWRRKGGDIALKVLKELNNLNIDAHLSIVGIEPDKGVVLPSNATSYGFISKSTAEGRQLLAKLIEESHFLILPTRADCTPIVFSEFNAYGIPVITTNVGGIPTLVKRDVNGVLFNLDESPSEYAKYIAEKLSNFREYEMLAESSYNEYQTRLNWKISSQNFMKLIKELGI